MHTSAWIALIRQFPQSVHNNLTFITRIGREVSVQNIFRIEPDYIVVRGRLSGTTDEGRVFILPFDEMHALGFQKPMKEHEFEAVFNGLDPKQAVDPKAAETEQAAAASPEPQEPPPKAAQPTPVPVSAPAEVKPAKPPSKVLLLQRVRARLAAASQAKAEGTT
jgi:hypothetical protein